MATVKLSISIDDELLKRADEAADRNFMTRSGIIQVALNQYLLQDDVTRAIKSMAVSMRKIADTGTVDKETLEDLQELEAFAKIVTAGGF